MAKKTKGIGNRVGIVVAIAILLGIAYFVPVTSEGTLFDILLSTQQQPEPIACTLEFAPVCGVDGITYSNACHAGANNVEIAFIGECSSPETGEMLVSEPTSAFCKIYPTFPQCQ